MHRMDALARIALGGGCLIAVVLLTAGCYFDWVRSSSVSANLKQFSASSCHRARSASLIAFAACRRHSSAFFRYLSARVHITPILELEAQRLMVRLVSVSVKFGIVFH